MPKTSTQKSLGILSSHFAHYLIGFSILMKGYAKLEHHHSLGEVIPIFFAGMFIVLGAAFHHRIEKRIKNFKATFHVAEGIALIFIGIVFLKEGSSQIPYFYFFLGMVYLVIGFLFYFINEENKERMEIQTQLWIGIVFLLAGLLAFLLNLIQKNTGWAIAVSLLLAAAGIMLIVMSIRKRKSRLMGVSKQSHSPD
jgi:uncharacterized membrane protein HdeD (DUF308 family)